MKRKVLLSPLAIIIVVIVLGVGGVVASVLIGGAGGTEEVNLQKGLVGHWKFDGNAKDATANSNHGTLTGTTLTTDRKGQANKAYSFNGTTDFISLATPPTTFTFSGWFLWGRSAKDSGIQQGPFTSFYQHTANDYLYISNGSSYFAAIPTVGQWNHIVVTASGNQTTVKVFLNGVKHDNSNPNANGFGTPSEVGRNTFNSSAYFQGSIDDVRTYNRVLSDAEITALYQEYDPGIVVSDLQKGLVGNWKFDGNAKDATANSNHGTLTGTTLTTDRKGQANKAYSFNGTSDSMSFPNVLNTAGTISVWVKWLRNAVGYGTQGLFTNFIYQHNANNYLYTFTWSGAYSYFAYAIPLDTWTHLVFTWTNSSDNSTLKLYANNVLYNPNPGAGGYGSISAITGLSSGGAWGNAFFNAIVDDVRVYNRALSTTEITALYQSYDPGIVVSDLQKGLVGNWKFDGNAKDATANSNHGTLTGATLTTDRKGQANKAYSFNGTSDYITIANESNFDALLDGQHPFSVDWWSNVSGVGASRIILSKGDDPQTTAIYRSTSNGYSFHIKNTATYQLYVYASAENETAGVWTHWVYTYDGSGAAAGVKQYKNGVIQTLTVNTDTLGATTQLNNIALKIGAIATPAWYFGGSMDDVRIYNRALSAAEVTALYQSY